MTEGTAETVRKACPKDFTRFYLAGGTAIALQIGHRRSIDLIFHTLRFEPSAITRKLNKSAKYFREKREKYH
jgi:hypothetical protein